MINSKTLELRVCGKLDKENERHRIILTFENMVEMLCGNIWGCQHSPYTGCNERYLNQHGMELGLCLDMACWTPAQKFCCLQWAALCLVLWGKRGSSGTCPVLPSQQLSMPRIFLSSWSQNKTPPFCQDKTNARPLTSGMCHRPTVPQH